MINLLPQEVKKEIRAARTNVLLLRYNFLNLASIFFLILVLGFVYMFLMSQFGKAKMTIQENDRRENTYASVKQEAEMFRAQLADAKKVFNEEVSYSRALLNVASLFPTGTAISSLDLNSQSFKNPTSYTVKVTGETAAKQLITNLESSRYVTGVKRGAITIGDAKYPYSMEVTFTLTPEAAR